MNLEIFNEMIEKIKGIEFETQIDFDISSFPEIPENIKTDQIKILLRQRFVRFGLIDNVIIQLTKKDSIALGLWILGTCFQKKFDKYVLHIDSEGSSIKEIWIDFRPKMAPKGEIILDNPHIQKTLKKFVWNANSVEDFTRSTSLYNQQKTSIFVTNPLEDWFTLDQFYKRDILVGFGKIEGVCIAAEFFLNLGLDKSYVNYAYIKYEYAPNIACENSCEIRAELIQENQKTEDFISENN